MSKYKNKKTKIDGIVFDSIKEAKRYQELKVLEKNGVISNLELQPAYKCVVNDKWITTYKADFRYFHPVAMNVVVEDVKSPMTAKLPVYRIKKKLVKALFDVDIVEV